MRVAIPKESCQGECRVAATPQTVNKLKKMGFDVFIEAGAGLLSTFTDHAYEEAGAQICDSESIWSAGELMLKINAPSPAEQQLMPDDLTLISLVFPAQNAELLDQLSHKKTTLFALDTIPRISRAQKMDVLSSMANIAGYRAVVEAANRYGGFFSGQITAAGKSRPAKVLVIGAGVAGLAAIGAARGLGAEVLAFDTRPVVREQVESLGAQFLEVQFEEDGAGGGGYAKVMSEAFIAAEMALFAKLAETVDIVITTALIPGRRAPILWKREFLTIMKAGSVVVDLAAKNGGNCEGTVADEVVIVEGVHLIGYTDLTSRLPRHASELFSQNIVHLLSDMGGGADFHIDEDDVCVRGALVLNKGGLTWPPPKIEAPVTPTPPPEVPVKTTVPEEPTDNSGLIEGIGALIAAVCLTAIGLYAPGEFIQHFSVFLLSCFVGWQVVWNVAAALHTPLMSVTNAISGIILVGGIVQAGSGELDAAAILGAIAILVATINIAGGFWVTRRMLLMFQR